MRITANQVTFSRLVLMPLLCGMLYGGETAQLWAVILGTIIGCTDFVDGYLARKHGPTVLGGLMDPIADKVFIAVAFLPYAERGWAPWWLVVALFVREFLVTALRSSFELRQLSLRTSYLAKVKTWVQMCGLGLLLLALVVKSPTAMTLFLGVMTVLPLVGAAIFRVLKGKTWLGAIIGGLGFGGCLAAYRLGGTHLLTIAMFTAIVGVTWASGLDYLVTAGRKLFRGRDLHAFDAVRIVGAIALPVLAVLVMIRVDAATWAVVTLVSLELGHGGLDNLLAHHGAAANATRWGGRVLGASALLAVALVVPAWADALAVAACAVSLVGTAVAFWTNRRYYLEEKLREKKRAITAEAA